MEGELGAGDWGSLGLGGPSEKATGGLGGVEAKAGLGAGVGAGEGAIPVACGCAKRKITEGHCLTMAGSIF